jgi:hypothetical protein
MSELSKMARPLAIRQQALATAQVYVRRLYLKIEIRNTNPALVLATALYLACKMEECPQHIRMVLAEARHCWGEKTMITCIDPTNIGRRYIVQRHLKDWRMRIHTHLRDELTAHHTPPLSKPCRAANAIPADARGERLSVVHHQRPLSYRPSAPPCTARDRRHRNVSRCRPQADPRRPPSERSRNDQRSPGPRQRAGRTSRRAKQSAKAGGLAGREHGGHGGCGGVHAGAYIAV